MEDRIDRDLIMNESHPGRDSMIMSISRGVLPIRASWWGVGTPKFKLEASLLLCNCAISAQI